MGQACCVPHHSNRVIPGEAKDDNDYVQLNQPFLNNDSSERGSHRYHPTKGISASTQHESSSSSFLLPTTNSNLPNSSSQYINLQQNQEVVGLENILVMINSEQLQLLQQLISKGPPQDKGVQTESPQELRRFWSHKTIQQASSFTFTKDDFAIGNPIASHSSSSSEEIEQPVRTSTRSMKNSGKKLRRKRSNASSVNRSISKDKFIDSDNGQDADDRKSIVNIASPKSRSLKKFEIEDDKPEQEDTGKEEKENPASSTILQEPKLNIPNGLSPYSDEEGYSSSGALSTGGSETEGSSPRTKRQVHMTTTLSTGVDQDGKKTVNEYVVIKKIGRGMHGKVKLCKKSDTGELCALKIINKSILKDLKKKDKLGRPVKDKDNSSLMILMKEVSILKKLHHPNVVELYEVIDDPKIDKLFLVFEYIESGCLMKIISKDKTDRPAFTEETCRRYYRDLICGLEYLHENKIVHRDIKPENVLVTKDDRLKITDFGVSSMLEGDNDTFNTAPGTPAFLSPEACHVGSYSGYASDIWAAGVTLFVMLYGRLPFFGPGILGMYNAILNDEPEIPENIEPDLQDLLTRLFCKDPHRRITIKEIKEHAWITMNGKWPFVTQVDKIEISTDQEIAGAITVGREMKVVDRFMLLSKMKAKLSKRVKKAKEIVRQRNEGISD
ncbi:predicted protein [Naegleria gruberi]|uniref:Predicted protein n=1 Tax=Naegleria gruberi TaxID=5762 RepID=D2VL46_NAEGR|nr:uncharacterized protein NAEGRDRAFT_69658 [Naegleria gruberi]EFC42555.1 predicted protein [Naegleria gruberi]|eukprot:XP_002675299.1 predicted protein [Naegleria gruberi strain NEG-M]